MIVSWHLKNRGALFEKEKRQMAEKYPDFSLFVDDAQDDAVAWTGEARFLKNGACLQSLRIRVVCPKDYPNRFPYVTDDDETLTPKMCDRHMHGHNHLCYGTGLDDLLNVQNLSVANVVLCVNYFVANLWCFENTGEWPHGRFHQYAFLDHEINKGSIDKNAPCPCGTCSSTYKKCRHAKNLCLLEQGEKWLRIHKRQSLIAVGTNTVCPCNSGKKYKRCCALKHGRENYSRSPLFMLLKYPEINCQQAEKIWQKHANNPGEFGQLIRKSPIGRLFAK